MRKFWFTVALVWAISIVYFIVYVNSPALRTAVDRSSALSFGHGLMDLALLGGGFALIAGGIYRLFHRD
ncbi:hypothetical protein [Lacticaseibacillus daqingensis]|uniref:hypothetical protein n=1 Tax=Lacticaseibacillus daqingensis TaxID=2486014 RepID=UPI000F7666C7|nr:hypothetical protein [Lacticaseibacillus daqingensis]